MRLWGRQPEPKYYLFDVSKRGYPSSTEVAFARRRKIRSSLALAALSIGAAVYSFLVVADLSTSDRSDQNVNILRTRHAGAQEECVEVIAQDGDNGGVMAQRVRTLHPTFVGSIDATGHAIDNLKDGPIHGNIDRAVICSDKHVYAVGNVSARQIIAVVSSKPGS